MIGIDIIEIARIKQILAKPKIMEGIFSQDELEYCHKQINPAQSFAGLFCAKEAVIKAFGNAGALSVRSVHITHDLNGKPRAELYGEPYEISITHCESYAAAVALRLEKK